MKKYILSFLLIGMTVMATAQLKYQENAKTYFDAGIQFTYEGGVKIAFGTRLNDRFSVGLSMLKGSNSEMLNMGIDARLSLRKPTKRAGLLIHGGYSTSIIQSYENTGLLSPELGLGAIMDNFSITAGVKHFSIRNTWGDYQMASIFLQTMYHFGSINPELKAQKRKESTYYQSEEDKAARRKANLESPIYFDASIGFAYLSANSSVNQSYSDFYYNVAVGWQKTPWLGFGLNYTLLGSPGYDGLKALGVSWRARPKLGYFKATLNIVNDFEKEVYSYFGNESINTYYNKRRIPPSLNIELGTRFWGSLLIKAGYLFQSPFDMEVTSETNDFSGFGNNFTRTTEIRRIKLGYFHMGIGFIL